LGRSFRQKAKLFVMDATVTKVRVLPSCKESKLVTVLSAYEDAATATRGVQYCKNLGRYLGSECLITQQVWLFNEFRVSKLAEIAAEEAARADVIVISAHHAVTVPGELRSWIELWLGLRGKTPAVLVALLDPLARGTPTAIEEYLQEVAQRSGLELIFELDEARADR
jgi:hypothetical protein